MDENRQKLVWGAEFEATAMMDALLSYFDGKPVPAQYNILDHGDWCAFNDATGNTIAQFFSNGHFCVYLAGGPDHLDFEEKKVAEGFKKHLVSNRNVEGGINTCNGFQKQDGAPCAVLNVLRCHKFQFGVDLLNPWLSRLSVLFFGLMHWLFLYAHLNQYSYSADAVFGFFFMAFCGLFCVLLMACSYICRHANDIIDFPLVYLKLSVAHLIFGIFSPISIFLIRRKKV